MSHYASRFWQSCDRYHDLAERYERDIEITHPGHVTSDRLSPFTYYGTWNRTAVLYYEYRGESV